MILDNSGRYCSVYVWQDKTEHGWTKTTLISSVSHFSLETEALFGELSPQNSPRGHGTEFWATCIAWRKSLQIFVWYGAHIPNKHIHKILTNWLCD